MWRTLFLALLLGIAPALAPAQSLEPIATVFDSGLAVPARDTLPDSLRHSTMELPRPQVGRAFAELVILNGAAVAINNIARDLPTTRPETWWRNVRGGWIWDANNISTNNIEHPYGGSVYYNVARANGLSFWASAPVTVAGSLMWELFGEPVPPSLNDLIITSLSGITLGEATRRISLLVLDNRARGFSRVWREAAVLVFNPGMGIDRLSRGQTWRQRPNPADRRPSEMRLTVVGGAKHMTLPDLPGGASGSMDVAVAAVGLEFGDPFADRRISPFSSFTFTAELNSGPTTTLTELGTRGILASLGRRDGGTRSLSGIFLDFEYQWNEAYQFSEQGFGLGLLSRTGDAGWRLDTDISAELVPLLASSDPYTQAQLNRSYDYGAGIGGRAFARLERHGFPVVSAGYRGFWTATVSGVSSTKLIQFFTAEARAPLPFGLAAGAAYTLYLQRNTYAQLPGSTVSLPSWSVFISTAGR